MPLASQPSSLPTPPSKPSYPSSISSYPSPLIPHFSYLVQYPSFLLPNPSFLILYPTSIILYPSFQITFPYPLYLCPQLSSLIPCPSFLPLGLHSLPLTIPPPWCFQIPVVISLFFVNYRYRYSVDHFTVKIAHKNESCKILRTLRGNFAKLCRENLWFSFYFRNLETLRNSE